ncbi:ABC transporter transmembrane domain-containing protein [Methanobrevibacter olleyae]|uniref:ABC transporter transmembrane domain-containing protein n=1 Tax=Methanobrevibacter olleyae TaxID=294671 RepID=UPI00130EB6BC|nr:ABC transporter transmembrane domain-containing protein [Methanobrevibacter olleyae]
MYCNLTLPSYTADIVDIGIQNTDFNYIINVGTMMMIMVLIGVLATIALSYLSSKVSSAYGRDLRKMTYEKILKFSNFELNKISRSSLITRNTNDVYQIQTFLAMLFTTILFAPILGIGSIIKALELGTNLLWIIVVTFISVVYLLG